VTGADHHGGDDPAVDRAELLAAIGAGRDRFEAALAGYPDEAMLDRVDDHWTRKDVVAHVEAWERRVVDLVGALQAGEPPPDDVETDELNARFFAASRDRTLDDVRAGEREAFTALLASIDGCSDEELFDGRHFAWTQGDPLADWFRANGDEHYDEHLEQLTRPPR
jgi:hypothetical protein